MNRRQAVAAVALVVVALVVGMTLSMGKLQAGEPAASKKGAVSAVERLEKRIAALEERIAALENRPTPVLTTPNFGPALPMPPGGELQFENDGFRPAAILLINGKPAPQ